MKCANCGAVKERASINSDAPNVFKRMEMLPGVPHPNINYGVAVFCDDACLDYFKRKHAKGFILLGRAKEYFSNIKQE